MDDKMKNSQLITDMVAHQLRSSLSTANWYLEMLLDNEAGTLSEQQHDYLNELKAAHDRMRELVDELMSMTKIEMGTLKVASEPVDLKGLIEKLKNMFQPRLAAKKLDLKLELPKGALLINSDQKLLYIILENLLSNAVKYTPTEGRVSVKVEKTDKVKITVSDTGLGIPESQKAKIFERFFRADNVSTVEDGNGLGLYITKSLVEHLKGTIRFESEENKGTIFYIEL